LLLPFCLSTLKTGDLRRNARFPIFCAALTTDN
jgi:hypothetical protein